MQFCRGLVAVAVVFGFSIQCAVAQQYSPDQSGQYSQSQLNNRSAYPAYQRLPASQPPQGYRPPSTNQYQQGAGQQQAYPPRRGPQNVAPGPQRYNNQPPNRSTPPQYRQQSGRSGQYGSAQRAAGNQPRQPVTRSASNEFQRSSQPANGQYQPHRPMTPSDQARSNSGGSFQAKEAESATAETESVTDDQQAEEDPTEPDAPSEQSVTAAEIEEAIKATKDSDTSEEEKKSQLDYLTKALKWMESAKEYETKAAKYQVDVKNAPQLLDEAKQELDKEMPEPTCEREDDAKLPQLEQALGNAEEALKKAQEKLKKQEEQSDAKIRGEKKAKLDTDKESAAKQLEETQNELKAVTVSDDAPDLAAAQGMELQARAHAYKRQIELYDAEKLRFEALSELFPIERDLAQRDVAWHEKSVAAWQDVVTEFRNAESERQAAEARRIASRAHPAVKSLAERNAELAEERQQLTGKMEDVTGYLESAKKTLETLEEDYKSVTDKVEVAGMTPTIGLLLRSRRDWLPDVELHDERITLSQEEMQRAQVALLELKSERAESGDINEQLKQTLAELGDVAKEFPPGYFEEMVRVLLEDRRTYLDNLLADYQSYHDDLSDLYLDSRKLLAKTETYRSYIDEHVLWIPSAPRLGGKDLENSWVALTSFANAGLWSDVLRSTGSNVKEHPLASLMLVVV
jgi:potassium efflux system protein